MKQIKDYLHLYLGCRCTVANHFESILIGIHTNGKCQVAYAKGSCFWEAEYIKPVLRPLSDMSEDEAEHFAWLCLNTKNPDNEEVEVIDKDEIDVELVLNDGGLDLDNDVEIYIGVNLRCFDGYIAIMKDGRIGIADEFEPSSKMKPVDSVAEKVLYLLSCGFDLFSLIKAGLAIDKTQGVAMDSRNDTDLG